VHTACRVQFPLRSEADRKKTVGFVKQSGVRNLEVAVDDAVRVEVVNCKDELCKVEARLRLQERRMVLQHWFWRGL